MKDECIYLNEFTSRADVEDVFNVALGEDVELLLADYDVRGWNADAIVIGKRGGSLFMVDAWHNSECGMSQQWFEEEIMVKTLRLMLENGRKFNSIKKELSQVLDRLEPNTKVAE